MTMAAGVALGDEDDPAALRERLTFLLRDETAEEMLARTFVAPLHTGVAAIDRFAALRPGHILEACGGSGCGKTELLVQAAVTCLLPEEADGVRYGGNAGGVLYLDVDGRLDAARLPAALSRRIAAARAVAAGGMAPPPAAPGAGAAALCAADDPVYRASLARFRLLRCRSSAQLVEAAAALDGLLAPAATHDAAGGATQQLAARLLLIDNLGAHFWLDKATRPAPSSTDPFGDGRAVRAGVLDLAAVHGALSGAVRAASRRRRIVVVATKAAYAPPAPPAPPTARGVPGPTYRDYMPKAWTDCVTHRLTLYRPDAARGRVLAHWAHPLQAPAGELLSGLEEATLA